MIPVPPIQADVSPCRGEAARRGSRLIFPVVHLHVLRIARCLAVGECEGRPSQEEKRDATHLDHGGYLYRHLGGSRTDGATQSSAQPSRRGLRSTQPAYGLFAVGLPVLVRQSDGNGTEHAERSQKRPRGDECSTIDKSRDALADARRKTGRFKPGHQHDRGSAWAALTDLPASGPLI